MYAKPIKISDDVSNEESIYLIISVELKLFVSLNIRLSKVFNVPDNDNNDVEKSLNFCCVVTNASIISKLVATPDNDKNDVFNLLYRVSISGIINDNNDEYIDSNGAKSVYVEYILLTLPLYVIVSISNVTELFAFICK